MIKVLVPFAQGFEEIEALTLVDVLRRSGVEVVMAALDSDVIEGAHGVKVHSDVLLKEVVKDDFDAVVLPGGLPGSEYLAKSEMLKGILKRHDDNKKLLGAICAAPWALGEAGVLKSSYTCYPSFEKVIMKNGYISKDDIVIDENIITSRGPATAMKFALAIVKALCGDEKYHEVKSGLLA